jgi:hypothetical protein
LFFINIYEKGKVDLFEELSRQKHLMGIEDYPYQFVYSCVYADDVDELNFIVDNMDECPMKELLTNVGFENINDNLLNGVRYTSKRQLLNDWSINSFKYKGNYYNETTGETTFLDLYVFANSSIEYIFKKVE